MRPDDCASGLLDAGSRWMAQSVRPSWSRSFCASVSGVSLNTDPGSTEKIECGIREGNPQFYKFASTH